MTNPHANAIEAAARAFWIAPLHDQPVVNYVREWPPTYPGKLEELKRQMTAAVAAYLAAMETAGLVFAPVKATNKQLGEGHGASLMAPSGLANIEAIYAAMIAARPRVEGV